MKGSSVKIGVYLRTVSYLIAWVIAITIAIIPTIIVALLPEKWRYDVKFLYWLEHFIYRLFIASWWVPVTYKGLENIPQHKSLIFAANHESAVDIPLLGVLAKGHPHMWIMWVGLAKFPVFGFVARRLQIIVDTSTPFKAARALSQAISHLNNNGKHLMIFPEGARFTDGTVHDFFKGFAIIAKRTHRPVVPVYIRNGAKVCPPKTVWINYKPLEVVVGPPFFYYEEEDEQTFLNRVHAWFVEQQQRH